MLNHSTVLKHALCPQLHPYPEPRSHNQHILIDSLADAHQANSLKKTSSNHALIMPPRHSVVGPDGYSINPSTRRVRNRLANLPPDKLEEHKVYSREYGALFQACIRQARRADYKAACIDERRLILMAALEKILENRYVHFHLPCSCSFLHLGDQIGLIKMIGQLYKASRT